MYYAIKHMFLTLKCLTCFCNVQQRRQMLVMILASTWLKSDCGIFEIVYSRNNHLWRVILKASLLARISNTCESIPYFREISLPAALFRFQGSREHEGEEYKQEKIHRNQEKNDRKKKERIPKGRGLHRIHPDPKKEEKEERSDEGRKRKQSKKKRK